MLVNKNHPALKHGGYSTTTILPTESVAEFGKLHKDLISELVPNGALADDIVATITRMVWRKRNLPTFRIAKVARFKYEIIMRREFSRMLPEQTPPREFQGGDYSEADAEKLNAIYHVVRKELGDDAYKLATVGETATVDGLMNDLEVRERLNATIERGLKRLLFVKGLESILAPSSSLPSKRLAGFPRAPASAKRSMPVRVKKSHPALKHGGYAATVLPGESVYEFEKLRQDLIVNFTADGALEEDIVADLAGRLWRKQNRATFRAAEVARQHYNAIVSREVDKLVASELAEEEEQHKEAREWYGMTEENILRRKAMLAEREKAIRAADDIARNELGDMYELAKMADTATVACLMEDLAVEERLDAAIDKCLKRLLLVKGLKSISVSSSSAPLNRITGPSEAA
jgi:hypothetical protein